MLAGSGKSTLLRLMLRQHDARPGRGWVAVNGTDVRLLRRESLYAAVAAVPQQVSLVNGTIASNIAFGWCVLPRPPSHGLRSNLRTLRNTSSLQSALLHSQSAPCLLSVAAQLRNAVGCAVADVHSGWSLWLGAQPATV